MVRKIRLTAPKIYRQYEQKLGIAQRAKNKKRAGAIHAKIKNIRQNMLHQFSHKLVFKHAAIIIGNVNAKVLAQTKLAKSVLDASWTTLRTMLKYKCENAGVCTKKSMKPIPPKLARAVAHAAVVRKVEQDLE